MKRLVYFNGTKRAAISNYFSLLLVSSRIRCESDFARILVSSENEETPTATALPYANLPKLSNAQEEKSSSAARTSCIPGKSQKNKRPPSLIDGGSVAGRSPVAPHRPRGGGQREVAGPRRACGAGGRGGLGPTCDALGDGGIRLQEVRPPPRRQEGAVDAQFSVIILGIVIDDVVAILRGSKRTHAEPLFLPRPCGT